MLKYLCQSCRSRPDIESEVSLIPNGTHRCSLYDNLHAKATSFEKTVYLANRAGLPGLWHTGEFQNNRTSGFRRKSIGQILCTSVSLTFPFRYSFTSKIPRGIIPGKEIAVPSNICISGREIGT